MTRTLALAALVASLLAACITKRAPSNDGQGTGGVNDFIIPSGGGGGGADLAGTSPGGCWAFAACYSGCDLDPDPQFCSDDCVSQAPQGALDTFQAALGCAQSWCLDKGGTSTSAYKCALSSDQTMLVNLNGSAADPGTTCGTCLENATAALFLSTCTSLSSPDCNPSACAVERSACLDN